MHLVFLSRSLAFPAGLAGTQRVRLLARGLQERGHRVEVLLTRPSERPGQGQNAQPRGIDGGIPFEYTTGSTVRSDSFLGRRVMEARGFFVAAARLVARRPQDRVDCVYLYGDATRWSLGRSLFLVLLRCFRVPVVLDLGEHPWTLKASRNLMERHRSPLRGITGVVAISTVLGDWARSEFQRIDRKPLVTEIPIVVDHDEFRKPGTRENGGQVLFASSPAYGETLEYIVEAMQLVWRAHPTCRLVVTGWPAGSEPAALRGEDSARVVLAGVVEREELAGLYGRSDALLAPLFDDVRSKARFPSKIAEYLASGRPVVTTAIGDVARYLVDGETAFVSGSTDVAAFAGKIIEALDRPDRADEIGSAGAGLAAANFDYTVQAPRLETFIAGVCRADEGVARHG